MAARALLFGGAGLATRSAATCAGFLPRDFDFAFHAEHRLLEADLQLVEEVVAFARAIGGAATAATAEEIAESAAEPAAEHLVEDVVQIHAGESAARARTAARVALRIGLVAELVVHLAFLFVAEHFISGRNLLEFLLRLLVARVAVRMVFHRLLAERLFDFVLCRRTRHFQYTIIIF